MAKNRTIIELFLFGALLLSMVSVGAVESEGEGLVFGTHGENENLVISFERIAESPISVDFRITVTNRLDEKQTLPLTVMLDNLTFQIEELEDVRMWVWDNDMFVESVPVYDNVQYEIAGYENENSGLWIEAENEWRWEIISYEEENVWRFVKSPLNEWYFKGKRENMIAEITIPKYPSDEGWGAGTKVFEIRINTGLKLHPEGGWGSAGVMSWDIDGFDEPFVDLTGSSWWKVSWSYRIPITVNDGGEGNPDNYSHRIVIDNSDNLSDHASVGLRFIDLRFLENEDSGELDYYIDNWTSDDTAVIYFRRPDNADATVYLYYGNDAAGDVSNPETAFIFGDSFEGDYDQWTESSGDPVVTIDSTYYIHGSNSMKVVSASGDMLASPDREPLVDNYELRWWARMSQTNKYVHAMRGVGGVDFWMLFFREDGGIYTRPGFNYTKHQDYLADVWYELKLIVDVPNNTKSVWIDGVLKAEEATLQADTYTDHLTIGSNDTGTSYVDGVFLRKYVDPEPVLIFGAEEEAPPVNVAPDKPENLLPSARQTSTTVALYTDVHDNDGDPINVYFHDNSDNSLIDNVWADSDTTATVNWTGLVRGDNYVFFAHGCDGTENGENSDTQSFMVNTLPIVENQETENEVNPTQITTLTPQLSWEYYDADGDYYPFQSAFWLQVGTSENENDMRDYLNGYDDNFYIYEGAALSRGVTYHWRVMVHDGYEWGDWVWGGTFKINVLPVVENQLTDGQVNPTHVTNFNPRLSWDYYDPEDAQTNYMVEVGTTENGNDMVGFYLGTHLQYYDYGQAEIEEDLCGGVTYHWRVKVMDGFEYSDWYFGATFRIGEWNQIESWSGTVTAPAAWNQIESWSGTVIAPAYWNQIESWSGTVTAQAGYWNQIESWSGTVTAQAGYWNQIESWSGTVTAQAGYWNQIESWSGTVTAQAGYWGQIETWSGTVTASANWNQIESWSGTVTAPANWNQIESWSGTVIAQTGYWGQIESWSGTVTAPSVHVENIQTYDNEMNVEDTFAIGDNVIIQFDVKDNLGAADIEAVYLTITDPNGENRVDHEGILTFQDKFDNEDAWDDLTADHWNINDGSGATPALGDDSYYLMGESGGSAAYKDITLVKESHQENLTEVTITVDVYIDYSTEDSERLIFRYLDNDYYIAGFISETYSAVGIEEYIDGTRYFTDTSALFSEDTWYQIKVTTDGSTASIYVDDVLKVTKTDLTERSGRVGLGCDTGWIYFDNYFIGNPNGEKIADIENGYRYRYTYAIPDNVELAGTWTITAEAVATATEAKENKTITVAADAPVIRNAAVYDENIVVKTEFRDNENVVIRCDMVDIDNENLPQHQITIINPQGATKVDNATMDNITAVSHGYTYEYSYIIPQEADSNGTWTIRIYAEDNDGNYAWDNDLTFTCDIKDPEIELLLTYTTDDVERTEYDFGETVRIKAEISDPEGRDNINSVLLTIQNQSDDEVVKDTAMSDVGDIDNGNIYNYDYVLPTRIENRGTWDVTVTTTDGVYTTTSVVHFVLDWYDNDFDYRIPITLVEKFSVNHDNEELGFVLVVDTSKLVDGSDARIVTDRGVELPFRIWKETTSGTTLTVYYNFLENINADNTENVYIYYDNDTTPISYPNYATDMNRTLVETVYELWYNENAGDNITYGKAIKVHDIDDDGDNEIIVVGRTHAGTAYNRGFIRIYEISFTTPASATLTLKDNITWLTDSHTFVYSLDVADVDDDGTVEIVTGGVAYDGTQNRAELNVWSYSGGFVNEDNTTWYTDNTAIYGVYIVDVEGDGDNEILVAGATSNYENGMFRIYSFMGGSLTLEVAKDDIYLSAGKLCELYGIATGDFYDDGGTKEIAVVGVAKDASNVINAFFKIYRWDNTTLSDDWTKNWYDGELTELFSVAMGHADNDEDMELVVGGNYFDGTRDISMYKIWNATGGGYPNTLVEEGYLKWYIAGHSSALTTLVGDIDLDNVPEITTIGFQNDGVLDRGDTNIRMWKGSNEENEYSEIWTDTTSLRSGDFYDAAVVYDLNADGINELVYTGRYGMTPPTGTFVRVMGVGGITLTLGVEEEIYVPKWNQIESWSGTVVAQAGYWDQIESWSGTVTAPAAWNQIESWSGTVTAQSGYWNQIESWSGTVVAQAGYWNQIESWSGTVTALVLKLEVVSKSLTGNQDNATLVVEVKYDDNTTMENVSMQLMIDNGIENAWTSRENINLTDNQLTWTDLDLPDGIENIKIRMDNLIDNKGEVLPDDNLLFTENTNIGVSIDGTAGEVFSGQTAVFTGTLTSRSVWLTMVVDAKLRSYGLDITSNIYSVAPSGSAGWSLSVAPVSSTWYTIEMYGSPTLLWSIGAHVEVFNPPTDTGTPPPAGFEAVSKYILLVVVLDEVSEPVVGATVDIEIESKLTSDVGTAVFKIPAGGYTVAVQKEGYENFFEGIPDISQISRMDVTLEEVVEEEVPTPEVIPLWAVISGIVIVAVVILIWHHNKKELG